MRLALLTDIHGNAEALGACLAQARAAGIEQFVILGDLVGYGPDPRAIVDTVSGLAASGAIVLMGNHDEAIAAGAGGMNVSAAQCINWARGELSVAQRTYLAGLPMTHRQGDILFVHASAAEPREWHYIDNPQAAVQSLNATDARLTFCGHTHLPVVFHRLPGKRVQAFVPVPERQMPFSQARRYLSVVGSVGQPRDHDPRACWGELDDQGLTLHRVAYDIDATVRKIKAAGLPEWIGLRLYQGR